MVFKKPQIECDFLSDFFALKSSHFAQIASRECSLLSYYLNSPINYYVCELVSRKVGPLLRPKMSIFIDTVSEESHVYTKLSLNILLHVMKLSTLGGLQMGIAA